MRAQLSRRRVANASKRLVRAASQVDLRPQCVDRRRLVVIARNTSRQMTLPEPSQIELSGDSRYNRGQHRFFDKPVAAETLERFADDGERSFADPILRHGRRDAAKLGLAHAMGDRTARAIAWPPASRPRDSIANPLTHSWPTAARRAAGQTPRDSVHDATPADRLTHRAGRTERAIESRVVDHFEDRANSASFLADQDGECVVELHFARGVRAIPQLALQPL